MQETPGDTAVVESGQNVASAPAPHQQEMPFGLIYGRAITRLPDDLYIPPDALEVFLEAFEGPLDLLLYLIKRQNLDILDIPVAQITTQYVEYVELMKSLNLELAAEYLVMAALLGEIKSRMLLPRPPAADDDDEALDPRAELIRRLQEYERYKQVAEEIDLLPREERDFWCAHAKRPDYVRERPDPDVDLKELLMAFKDVLKRADMYVSHQVAPEKLSTRERMSRILDQLRSGKFVPFVSLFTLREGRAGVVVTLLALLELIKSSLVELVQAEAFAPIHVKARTVILEGEESPFADEDESDEVQGG
jgi:segregation and condensation protein A